MTKHTTPHSNIPNADAVSELEAKIANDGFANVEAPLGDLVEHAARAGAPAKTLLVLADPTAGEAPRAAALVRLVDDWPYYERRLRDRERTDTPDPVELIDAWREHEDLRHGGAEVRELWSSRRHLDAVRDGLREAGVPARSVA